MKSKFKQNLSKHNNNIISVSSKIELNLREIIDDGNLFGFPHKFCFPFNKLAQPPFLEFKL